MTTTETPVAPPTRDDLALLVQGCRDRARMIEFMITQAGDRQGLMITNMGTPHCYMALPTYNSIDPVQRPGETYREALDRWEQAVVIFTYRQVIRAWDNGKTAREIVDMAYAAVPDWAPGWDR